MEKREYNLCAAIGSLMGKGVDAGHEKSVSDELTDGKGAKHCGIVVPWEVFGRTLTTANGGGAIQTNKPGELLVKPLAAKTILAAAGARFVNGIMPGYVEIPKASNVNAKWSADETAEASMLEPAFKGLPAKPHTISGCIDLTHEIVLQSCVDVQTLIAELILESMGREIDRAALAGSGENGEPHGIVGTAGVHAETIATAGSATAAEIAAFVDDVAASDADDDKIAFVAPSAVRANLRDIRRKAVEVKNADNATVGAYGGEPVMANGRIFDKPLFVSNVAPEKKLVAGDFSEVAVLTWGKGVEILVDRYTLAKSGVLRVVAFLDVDVVVRNPGAFAVGTVLA